MRCVLWNEKIWNWIKTSYLKPGMWKLSQFISGDMGFLKQGKRKLIWNKLPELRDVETAWIHAGIWSMEACKNWTCSKMASLKRRWSGIQEYKSGGRCCKMAFPALRQQALCNAEPLCFLYPDKFRKPLPCCWLGVKRHRKKHCV